MKINTQITLDCFRVIEEKLSNLVIGQPMLVKALTTLGVASLMGIPYHVLIIGPPGTGKTWSVRSLCELLGLPYVRIQGNPDLLPGDVLGDYFPYFNLSKGRVEVELIRGPIFKASNTHNSNSRRSTRNTCGILFVDEINRMHPRTLNFLVEVMAEQQITIKGSPKTLPVKINVVATANVLEEEGTFPIPKHIIDRFSMVIELNYPDEKSEIQIVEKAFEREFNTKPDFMTLVLVVKLVRALRNLKIASLSTRAAINILKFLYLNYGSTEPRYLLSLDDEIIVSLLRRSLVISNEEKTFLHKIILKFKDNLQNIIESNPHLKLDNEIQITEDYLKNLFDEVKRSAHAENCVGDCSKCGLCFITQEK
ncbi:MAG: MoxR family ATPase [Ignisphaera sp.]